MQILFRRRIMQILFRSRIMQILFKRHFIIYSKNVLTSIYYNLQTQFTRVDSTRNNFNKPKKKFSLNSKKSFHSLIKDENKDTLSLQFYHRLTFGSFGDYVRLKTNSKTHRNHATRRNNDGDGNITTERHRRHKRKWRKNIR